MSKLFIYIERLTSKVRVNLKVISGLPMIIFIFTQQVVYAQNPVDYATEVVPLLRDKQYSNGLRCTSCHVGTSPSGSLLLTGTPDEIHTRLLAGRVDISNPASSLLLVKPSSAGQNSHAKFSEWGAGQTDYNLILRWIQEGASKIPVSVDEQEPGDIPKQFTLEQNYPNPFNPITNIKYRINETGLVTLNIFNTTGKKVRMLVNQVQGNGLYTAIWDGKDEQGNKLASGLYFYQMTLNQFSLIRKMIYVK